MSEKMYTVTNKTDHDVFVPGFEKFSAGEKRKYCENDAKILGNTLELSVSGLDKDAFPANDDFVPVTVEPAPAENVGVK